MGLFAQIEARLDGGAAQRGMLVAWSGGLDSTVLLHLLIAWSRRTGAEVAAVHVDHQLRPSSAADAAFCTRLAHQWRIPLVVETLDIHPRGSVQERARVQRYAAIGRAAQTLGMGTVATAHHADDAVETALLNFRRGTSSAGLSSGVSAGGAPIPSWPDLPIVRPLTAVAKQQLLTYAKTHDLEWRTDPTNASSDYERNRLRQKVIPALSAEGKRLQPMLDTLENLAEERRALESLADQWLERAELTAPDARSVAVDLRPLRTAPRAVLVEVLQMSARSLPGEVGFGRGHLRRLTDRIIAPGAATTGTVQMAVRGAVATIDKDLFLLEIAHGRGGRYLRERLAEPIKLGGRESSFSLPWFGTQIRGHQPASAAASSNSPSPFEIEVFDQPGAFAVRGPRPGDRLDARAMRGHKSVAALLSEAGVPKVFRWRWPLIVRAEQPDDVVWVCGLRRSEPASAAQPSAPSIHLRWDVDSRSVFHKIIRD